MYHGIPPLKVRAFNKGDDPTDASHNHCDLSILLPKKVCIHKKSYMIPCSGNLFFNLKKIIWQAYIWFDLRYGSAFTMGQRRGWITIAVSDHRIRNGNHIRLRMNERWEPHSLKVYFSEELCLAPSRTRWHVISRMDWLIRLCNNPCT